MAWPAQYMYSRLSHEFTVDRKWRLTKPLMYFHPTHTIVVPSGFITDLDSVPRVPVVYAAFKGRAVRSAVVHDYLYESQKGKAYADRMFLDAMGHEGVAARWRYPIYWAVVLFGGSIYARKRS